MKFISNSLIQRAVCSMGPAMDDLVASDLASLPISQSRRDLEKYHYGVEIDRKTFQPVGINRPGSLLAEFGPAPAVDIAGDPRSYLIACDVSRGIVTWIVTIVGEDKTMTIVAHGTTPISEFRNKTTSNKLALRDQWSPVWN